MNRVTLKEADFPGVWFGVRFCDMKKKSKGGQGKDNGLGVVGFVKRNVILAQSHRQKPLGVLQHYCSPRLSEAEEANETHE
uniref:Uncharacterized protein n=1 Tax=Knipowitschia caucasica TaxID=637954 RepID=A0AAV2KE02_KNICA